MFSEANHPNNLFISGSKGSSPSMLVNSLSKFTESKNADISAFMPDVNPSVRALFNANAAPFLFKPLRYAKEESDRSLSTGNMR